MANNPGPVGASGGGRRRRRGRQESMSWAVVDGDVLVQLVLAVTSQGGAIRFGLSRDGSALAVGILGDGDPYTEWLRSTDDLEAELAKMAARWNGEADS